jgi:hypothetical protein
MLLKQFLASKDDGVFVIGHASYLARLGGRLYLFDPVSPEHSPYLGYWTFWPEQIDIEALLPEIAGCFLSHVHEDHCDMQLLHKLTCPIYVMSGRKTMNDKMRELETLVVSCEPWEIFDVDGLDAYFVPHAFNSVDSSVAVRSKTFAFYFGNDNFLDDETASLVALYGWEFDVAALPYAFIHYYPHLLTGISDELRASETRRLCDQSMQQAIDLQFCLQAKITVPCGASLFYEDEMASPLNAHLATPYEFQRRVPNAVPLVAGSFVLASGAVGSSIGSREEYIAGIAAHLSKFKRRPVNVKTSPRYDMEKLASAMAFAPKINHRLYVSGGSDELLCFDFNIGQVYRLSGDDPLAYREPSYTHFSVEAPEYYLWASGDMTFEQMLGTRRFTYQRYPNEYNLQVIEFFNNYL